MVYRCFVDNKITKHDTLIRRFFIFFFDPLTIFRAEKALRYCHALRARVFRQQMFRRKHARWQYRFRTKLYTRNFERNQKRTAKTFKIRLAEDNFSNLPGARPIKLKFARTVDKGSVNVRD